MINVFIDGINAFTDGIKVGFGVIVWVAGFTLPFIIYGLPFFLALEGI